MGRSRMFGDDEPGNTDNQSPRRTIVGGRPPEGAGTIPPVPTGIQRLLRLASVDESFRRELVDRRGGIARAAGVDLTPSESAILAAIPAAQLLSMAEKMPPPPPPRREFLRRTAATAVVLLGGAALSECVACGNRSPGAQPDNPAETRQESPDATAPIRTTDAGEDVARPIHNEMESEGGAAPHEPPARPEHDEMMLGGGAAPDMPPARPEHDEMMLQGGAAPDMPPERPVRLDMLTSGGHAPDMPSSPPPEPGDGGGSSGSAPPE